jgi:hypothetical protein
MERVTGYLAADGTFFGQEDECIRYEQERLRFFALGQRTQYLLEPSTTGAKPDISKIRPEIAEHMEMAGACEMESPVILLLRHIRELLDNEEDHDQLASLIEILRYILDG